MAGSCTIFYNDGWMEKFDEVPADRRYPRAATSRHLARLRFGLVAAALLAALFVGQLVLGGVLRAGLHNADVALGRAVLVCWPVPGTRGVAARPGSPRAQ